MKSDLFHGDPYRPQFHFTPETGWMNDPNGLVYYDGEYHLFYQYLPGTIEQKGLKEWGHAVSSDLLHWRHLPPALYPNHLGAIWSGSAVIDWRNTSGFQTGREKVMVAIFTLEGEGGQKQGIAYSHDKGRTWTMYTENPVLPNPGLKDFRDPKVFWHEASSHWVMIIAARNKVMIYTSPDLKEWTLSDEFGQSEGAHGGVWECPDLFELAVDGRHNHKKWVMLVSMYGSAPNGGSGTQYFIGDFDGRRFTNTQSPRTISWVDYGRDNYAGVTFSDIPEEDGRRIFLAWMSNWWYAETTPTTPWRGAMTIPRELRLTTAHSGQPQLISLPVVELQSLRQKHFQTEHISVSDSTTFAGINTMIKGAFEVQIEWELATASEFGLRLKNDSDDETIIGYDVAGRRAFVNRQKSGLIDFYPDFAGYQHSARLLPLANTVTFHIFVDRCSVEVFANDGSLVITDLIFPTSENNKLEVYAQNGAVHLRNFAVWAMKSITGAWPIL